jgi:hypothetical protein
VGMKIPVSQPCPYYKRWWETKIRERYSSLIIEMVMGEIREYEASSNSL